MKYIIRGESREQGANPRYHFLKLEMDGRIIRMNLVGNATRLDYVEAWLVLREAQNSRDYQYFKYSIEEYPHDAR